MDKYLSKPWCGPLIIGLLACLVWGQTARFGFVWDDHILILDNTSIRSLTKIPEMFYSLDAQASERAPSWRPLRTAQYAVLFALAGKPSAQPWIFHLANILWHAAAAMLLFSVALLLFQKMAGAENHLARVVALLVAAAFAVHPVTSEVVCWAKSLDDIMAALFVLASARAVLKWNGDRKSYIAALIYFALAAYSKESAVPFGGMVFFIFYMAHQIPWKRCVKLTAPFLLVALVYVVHRHLVMGQSTQGAPLSGSYGQNLIDTIPAITLYLRLLWGIPPFCIDYGYMHGHLAFFSTEVLMGVALLVLWTGLTAWTWRTRRFRGVAFGLLWLGMFLLPVSNLVPMIQYLAERFLYLPLMGWLLALGFVLMQVRRRILAFATAAVVILIWIPVSVNRSEIWRDEATLFVRSSLENHRCTRIHENAVASIFNLDTLSPFFSWDNTSRELRVVRPVPRENAGPVLGTLIQVHDLFPDEGRFTRALGLTYAFSGQLTNAIPLLELSTRQSTNDAMCWTDLGTAYTVEKNWPKAHLAYETALRMSPTNIFALHLYTKLCLQLQEYQKALPSLKALEKLEPNNEENAKQLRKTEDKIQAAGGT